MMPTTTRPLSSLIDASPAKENWASLIERASSSGVKTAAPLSASGWTVSSPPRRPETPHGMRSLTNVGVCAQYSTSFNTRLQAYCMIQCILAQAKLFLT